MARGAKRGKIANYMVSKFYMILKLFKVLIAMGVIVAARRPLTVRQLAAMKTHSDYMQQWMMIRGRLDLKEVYQREAAVAGTGGP